MQAFTSREKEAYDLRSEGLSFGQIAARLGMDRNNVARCIRQVERKLLQVEVEFPDGPCTGCPVDPGIFNQLSPESILGAV